MNADVEEMAVIKVFFTEKQENVKENDFILKIANREIPILSIHFHNEYEVELHLFEVYEFAKEHLLTYKQKYQCFVTTGKVVRTNEFDEKFYYPKGDLGPNYRKEGTTFRLWAPTATAVRLVLFDDWHDIDGKEIAMSRRERGVWTMTIPGDVDGLYYNYKVFVNQCWNEAVDPYVKGTSINGEKGMVINLDKTNPPYWPKRPYLSHNGDAIIYEAHVRDLTIHPLSGVTNKGKYLGVSERGTVGPQQTKTGLNHLMDLGITHLELLPVNDFGSVDESKSDIEYNWGYDPIHYFSPEGSYSTDPYHGPPRIIELKQMIATLHENGIRVILDVVYNHVYILEKSDFEKIVPGYYFRFLDDGSPANGTGVGNDIASERLMVRKLILDCVTFWAKEYEVDGFRFDLMGILDIDTMNNVRNELDKVDDSILLLGEGWNLLTPIPDNKKAMIDNAKRMPGISHFNDRLRDGLKGSTFDTNEQGFINGNGINTEALKQFITGGITLNGESDLFAQPFQSINYIEAHDNHTLWDKLLLSNPKELDEIRKKMHRLATSIILVSQGIPFIHAGQEFYRTKYGHENSYNASDLVNQLDWQRKSENIDYVHYVKGLIQIRKQHPAFRLRTAEAIRKHIKFINTPSQVIGYMINHLEGIDEWKRIVVIHNGSWSEVEVELPYNVQWKIVVDEKRADLIPLSNIHDNKITVSAISTTILYE